MQFEGLCVVYACVFSLKSVSHAFLHVKNIAVILIDFEFKLCWNLINKNVKYTEYANYLDYR